MRVLPPLLEATHRGVVLSFDDGPERAVTEPLLDVLRELAAPAVFFVTASQVAGCEDLLVRMVEEGHVVASHGWDHVDFTQLHPVSQAAQLERASRALHAATGVLPTVFRAPYGKMDGSCVSLAARAGMEVLGWSLEGADWEDVPPQVIADRVGVPARRGDVILLHDGRKPHLRSAEVVSLLVPQLRARGLDVVSL